MPFAKHPCGAPFGDGQTDTPIAQANQGEAQTDTPINRHNRGEVQNRKRTDKKKY